MIPLVNTRITITKYRDGPRRDTGTIIEVRDTHLKPLRQKSFRRNRNKPRSQYIVTVRCDSGEVKSFYLNWLTYTVLETTTEEREKLSLVEKLKKWLREN